MSIHRLPISFVSTFGRGSRRTLTASEHQRLSDLFENGFTIVVDCAPEPSREELIAEGEIEDESPLLCLPVFIMVEGHHDEALATIQFGAGVTEEDTLAGRD